MWAPGGLFAAGEECGKEGGNQREQRGPGVIISLQFGLGCRRLGGGGWPRPGYSPRGAGWVKHHSRQTAALSGGLMQVDPATSKGSRKRFFSLICRQCLFLKFCSSVQHSLVTSRWRSVLISLGVGWGDFSLGVGLKGIEENNPISLLLPPQSWGRLQQRTSPPPQNQLRKS